MYVARRQYVVLYHTCIHIPVVPARGGAEVALRIYYKTFHIYRTCMRRAPAKPGVRAVCECVALLPSRNMTCVRPPCTARPREDFLHTSQFRLHIPHFARHTSSHLKPHFSKSFHTATFCTEKLLHTEAKSFCTEKLEAFAHRSFYTENVLHTANSDTEMKFSHTEAFTQRSFYTRKTLTQR